MSRLACLTMLLCSLSACTGLGGLVASGAGWPPAAPARELADTPFFPQTANQCGPAALATVLAASGVAVRPDDLSAQVYIPARRGSLQTELLAAPRRWGRIGHVIAPGPEALLAELAAGRPVLVFQNLGVRWWPVWHYAVVVGYRADRHQVILRSGKERRRLTNEKTFLRTWRRTGAWAMVVLRPGELPAEGDPRAFLRSVAAVEAAGFYSLAEQGYRSVLARSPQDTEARFGLANVLAARGELPQADAAYRAVLASEPHNVGALNNFADLRLREDDCGAARAAIERALSLAGPDHPAREVLQRTAAAVAAASPCRPAAVLPPLPPATTPDTHSGGGAGRTQPQLR